MEVSNSSHTDRLDRLAEEFVERYRRGEKPDLQEHLERHPDLADDISNLFPALIQIEQAPHGPASPLARVGDPPLLRELGRDSMGVVFEARQRSLGDTPRAHYEFLAPAERPDEIGLLGGYRILKVLGAGGMGVVFQAEDPKLKRKLAIKAMLPSLAASGSARLRFLREGRTIWWRSRAPFTWEKRKSRSDSFGSLWTRASTTSAMIVARGRAGSRPTILRSCSWIGKTPTITACG
jgi:hypothetical protein